MEALKAEGLLKNFSGLRVLQNVSFSMEVGERLAIIGPNGAGKTTLLNVLSGELSPTAGQIYVLGRDITTLAIHERLHVGLARSFQLNNLFLNLTALDNIFLALQGARASHFQMLRSITALNYIFVKAQELLELVGLREKGHVLVKALSYGEQRQMEIGLALASEPKVLLLDEPSAGLSSAETATVIDVIRNLTKDTAVLFCAHDMDVVFDLADRIIVLNFGQIIAQGIPEQIGVDPRVREIYLGSEEIAGNSGAS